MGFHWFFSFRLTRLYEKLGESDQAAAAYIDFVADEFRNADRSETSRAYKYLTMYYLKRDQLDQASHYAQKCLQFDDTKEDAKGFLRTIAQKRVKIDENPMVVSIDTKNFNRKRSKVKIFELNSFNASRSKT